MKLTAMVPKIGTPKEYIGKPFNNLEGNQIGQIINCLEKDGLFEITIDTDIVIQDKKISFEIRKKHFKYSQI